MSFHEVRTWFHNNYSLGVTGLYVLGSFALVVSNKEIFEATRFPYPIALSACHLTFTAFWGWIALLLWPGLFPWICNYVFNPKKFLQSEFGVHGKQFYEWTEDNPVYVAIHGDKQKGNPDFTLVNSGKLGTGTPAILNPSQNYLYPNQKSPTGSFDNRTRSRSPFPGRTPGSMSPSLGGIRHTSVGRLGTSPNVQENPNSHGCIEDLRKPTVHTEGYHNADVPSSGRQSRASSPVCSAGGGIIKPSWSRNGSGSTGTSRASTPQSFLVGDSGLRMDCRKYGDCSKSQTDINCRKSGSKASQNPIAFMQDGTVLDCDLAIGKNTFRGTKLKHLSGNRIVAFAFGAGCLSSVAVVCGNAAYMYCDIGFLQIVKQLNLFLGYGIGLFLGIEAWNQRVLMILGGMFCCGMLSFAGTYHFSFQGLSLQLASMIFNILNIAAQVFLLRGVLGQSSRNRAGVLMRNSPQRSVATDEEELPEERQSAMVRSIPGAADQADGQYGACGDQDSSIGAPCLSPGLSNHSGRASDRSPSVVGLTTIAHPSRIDPLSLVLLTSPVAAMVSCFCAGYLESTGAVESSFHMNFGLVLGSTLLAFGFNFLQCWALKVLGVLSFLLAGILKDQIIVLFDVIFFGAPTSFFQMMGFFNMTTLIILYFCFKAHPAAFPEDKNLFQSFWLLLGEWTTILGRQCLGVSSPNARNLASKGVSQTGATPSPVCSRTQVRNRPGTPGTVNRTRIHTGALSPNQQNSHGGNVRNAYSMGMPGMPQISMPSMTGMTAMSGLLPNMTISSVGAMFSADQSFSTRNKNKRTTRAPARTPTPAMYEDDTAKSTHDEANASYFERAGLTKFKTASPAPSTHSQQ